MRPGYHYAPAANWLSDPNGLVFHEDEWHLFYQYNPHGEDWGHMAWGHAVSRDLQEWTELPPALLEDDSGMVFSGSAVIDHDGLAGFGPGAMVALYTGAVIAPAPRQHQSLAWSGDNGRSWTRYPGNPVIDRGLADFRDPNVFWHEPTNRWIMVVALSNEHRALVYASHDLKVWDELSVIHGAGAPGEVWECPLLIELPVDGTDETRWLFKVDVLRGGPGSGALYQTGVFDGIRFIPDGPTLSPRWQVADMGTDFYAAIAWHAPRDAAGRPLWIGWIGNHAYQGQLPYQGWRGAMSLPRRIALLQTADGWQLTQTVEPAAVAKVASASPTAPRIPASCRISLSAPGNWSLTLADAAGRTLRIERVGAALTVARSDPGLPFLDAVQAAVTVAEAAVDVWLDHGSVEVIDEQGLTSLTLQHRMSGADYAARYCEDANGGGEG